MITSKKRRVAIVLLSCASVLQLTSLIEPALAAKSTKGKSAAASQSSTTAAQADEAAAVRGQLDSLERALAEGNARALASFWVAEGTYINDAGIEFKGRAALEKKFGEVFATEGKQLVKFVSGSVNPLSPGVILAEGTVRRQGSGSDADPETRYSMVFVKRDGAWSILQASERPFVANVATNPLQPLSWMIGEWKAERDGGFVHMKADWAANKNFIDCQYEVKKSGDSPQVDSRQVIGWDPRTGQPVSWHFDSNGGFGYGDWMKKDNQWLVRATGVERDGSISTATNVMSVSDPNNFSWQSVNRSVNGIVFGDTTPLKVQRVVK